MLHSMTPTRQFPQVSECCTRMVDRVQCEPASLVNNRTCRRVVHIPRLCQTFQAVQWKQHTEIFSAVITLRSAIQFFQKHRQLRAREQADLITRKSFEQPAVGILLEPDPDCGPKSPDVFLDGFGDWRPEKINRQTGDDCNQL